MTTHDQASKQVYEQVQMQMMIMVVGSYNAALESLTP